MKAHPPTFDGLFIVDGDLASYESFLSDESLRGTWVRGFSSGEGALCEVATSGTALWLVNIRLPDMSGITLLELIRWRVRQARIIIASDVYSRADELAARFAGATAYVCKPPSAGWLQAGQPRHRRPAMREARKADQEPSAPLRPP